MNYPIVIATLVFSTLSIAAPVAPKNCISLPVQGETLTIKVKKPSLIFIKNINKNDLWLTHPVQEPGASAGWTSKIQTNKWSAMVLTKDFVIACTETTPGHEQQIPCENAVNACLMKKARLPKNIQGEFWAGENMSLSELTLSLGARGFKIP